MFRNALRRWRSNMIAVAIVLTVLALAAVAIAIYVAYQRQASALVIERNRQVTYLSAARMKDQLGNFSNELSSLARMPGMYRGKPAEQQAELKRAGNRLAIFDGGVVLLDTFGKAQASLPDRPEVVGRDWSGGDFFGTLLTSSAPVFSDATDDRLHGPMVVTIGVPILGENGEFVGALAGMLRLGSPTSSSLYAGIVRLRIGQSGNTYLLDGKGRILYDSAYDSVGQIFDTRWLPGGTTQSDAGAVRTRDPDGHDVIVARARVPGTPWTLVTEDDWSALTQGTRRYANLLLVLLAVGMVIPAVGITILLRERHAETHEREQTEQETRAASLVQHTLLPQQVPMLPGWGIAVHYQPAGALGGDIYDMVFLPDGRLMVMMGDIADRSIPATMVIATTRAVLRSVARRMLPPGEALQQANDVLCPEMLPNMCVFCLYLLIEPSGDCVEFANAGHLLPFHCQNGTVQEVWASGSPLGLVLDSEYEQVEVNVRPGECLVMCSNGLIEARNTAGEMFGEGRVKAALAKGGAGAQDILDGLLAEFQAFIGEGWTQKDDVTALVLRRCLQGGGQC